MRVVGIVCEYNPFHSGHKRQIDILRENGAEVIVCAMSGNFTQRGEMTVADKYTRAESAIKCGADIVLELPFPYSSLSAEFFCSAGVHILSSVGCDTLSFGSESNNEGLLRRAAKISSSQEFISAYTEASKKRGSAGAYFDLLGSFLGEDANLLSNDILGISYISAIDRNNLQMNIFPIKRKGAAYNDTTIGESYPSATAVRKLIQSSEDGFLSVKNGHIPDDALEVFKNAQSQSLAPVFTENIGSDVLSFFKLMSHEDIIMRAINRSGGGEFVACDGCGIVERLCSSAKVSADFEEMLNRSYTSRYTIARINRVILFSIIGTSNIFEKALPEYTTLLGASEKGRNYLAKIRKTNDFPIVTKPADAPKGYLNDISGLADSLYVGAMRKTLNFNYFLKKHPFMGA